MLPTLDRPPSYAELVQLYRPDVAALEKIEARLRETRERIDRLRREIDRELERRRGSVSER